MFKEESGNFWFSVVGKILDEAFHEGSIFYVSFSGIPVVAEMQKATSNASIHTDLFGMYCK